MIFPGKAGKAHKSCPHCYKLVSRNAVTCPGCSAPCSKKRSVFTMTYASVIIIPAFSLIVCVSMHAGALCFTNSPGYFGILWYVELFLFIALNL